MGVSLIATNSRFPVFQITKLRIGPFLLSGNRHRNIAAITQLVPEVRAAAVVASVIVICIGRLARILFILDRAHIIRHRAGLVKDKHDVGRDVLLNLGDDLAAGGIGLKRDGIRAVSVLGRGLAGNNAVIRCPRGLCVHIRGEHRSTGGAVRRLSIGLNERRDVRKVHGGHKVLRGGRIPDHAGAHEQAQAQEQGCTEDERENAFFHGFVLLSQGVGIGSICVLEVLASTAPTCFHTSLTSLAAYCSRFAVCTASAVT